MKTCTVFGRKDEKIADRFPVDNIIFRLVYHFGSEFKPKKYPQLLLDIFRSIRSLCMVFDTEPYVCREFRTSDTFRRAPPHRYRE